MKTISRAAFAALSLCAAGSACAAVEVSGIIDTGMRVTRTASVEGVADSQTVVSQESAQFMPNLFALSGTEDLGNGLKAGFLLEHYFLADSGAMATEGVLFDNQALLMLSGQNWELGLGRIRGLGSTQGRYEVVSRLDPFLGGWNEAGTWGTFANFAFVTNNGVAIRVTPAEGFTAVGVWSSSIVNESTEGWGRNSHYSALGMQLERGPLYFAAAFEMVEGGDDWHTASSADEKVLKVGAVWDFGPVKFHGMYSLAKDVAWWGRPADSHSWMLGLSAPVAGGVLSGSIQGLHGEGTQNDDYHPERFVASVGYMYELSKRTSLWSVFSWSEGRRSLDADRRTDVLQTDEGRLEANRQLLSLGITHYF